MDGAAAAASAAAVQQFKEEGFLVVRGLLDKVLYLYLFVSMLFNPIMTQCTIHP